MSALKEEYNFRLAQLSDLEALARRYYEFFAELRSKQGWRPQSYREYKEEVKSYLERGDIFIVAETKGEIIGFARISERDGAYWIEEIYVHPSHRGKGLGKKLVEAVENEIKKHDIAAFIMVLPQDRSAFRFWVKMGYTLLNSIELAKDFKPLDRSQSTRTIEILGYPLKIAKWEKEEYSKDEKYFLDAIEKFYDNGGTQKEFIKIVTEAIEEWIKEHKNTNKQG